MLAPPPNYRSSAVPDLTRAVVTCCLAIRMKRVASLTIFVNSLS